MCRPREKWNAVIIDGTLARRKVCGSARKRGSWLLVADFSKAQTPTFLMRPFGAVTP
jgi:hypothetical protein